MGDPVFFQMRSLKNKYKFLYGHTSIEVTLRLHYFLSILRKGHKDREIIM